MLDDIARGAVDALVVYHLDRLHRQPRELEEFFDSPAAGLTKLATVTGDIDLSTHDGQFLARILGAVARRRATTRAAGSGASTRSSRGGQPPAAALDRSATGPIGGRSSRPRPPRSARLPRAFRRGRLRADRYRLERPRDAYGRGASSGPSQTSFAGC